MDAPFDTPQPDQPAEQDQPAERDQPRGDAAGQAVDQAVEQPDQQPDQQGLAEAELLEGLERDLAAVEEAMHTLDRIAADGVGGDAAAAQIAEVVSTRRFPDGAPVTALDLTAGR